MSPAYFILKNGLNGTISPCSLHKNPSYLTNETANNIVTAALIKIKPDKYEKDREFWKYVPHEIISKLYRVWKIDFHMFGYDPNQYFVEIGLEKVFVNIEDV